MRLIVRTLLGVLLLVTGAVPLSAQVARRMAPDSLWRRLWIVGAEPDADTFVEPRQTVVSGDAVYVLDLGTREVRGFARKTGKPTLVLTARGSGPGEYKRPRLLAAIPDGLAVLDEANFRLTGFDRAGRLRWDLPVPNTPYVSGICMATRSRLTITYRLADSNVVVFDTAGVQLGVRRIRWRVPRTSTMGFAHEAFLSGPTRTGDCALARYFGAEWARVGDSVMARDATFPLIEAGAEPVMQAGPEKVTRSLNSVRIEQLETSETAPIANGVMLRRDTVIVYGARTRQYPYRMLDYYDMHSGRYLYSRVLPSSLISLAVDADGTFYGTIITEAAQALVAFRPERARARAGGA